MRDIKTYQRRRSAGSVQRTISWESTAETNGGPLTHIDGVRTRLAPAAELLAAEHEVAAAVAGILGLREPGKCELSKVSWGDEDKEGDPKMAVTVLLEPEDAAAAVAIPVNLKGGVLAEELLELEQRAFAFADLKETGFGDVSYGDEADAAGDAEQAAMPEEQPALV